MTTTGATPHLGAPPEAPRDNTRTLAIIAIVLSAVALIGLLASAVGPLVALTLFGLSGSDGEAFGGLGSETGSSYGVDLPGAAEQPLAGADLAAAVAATESFLDRRLRCEDVPVVRPGSLAACRTLDEPRTFLVVELDGAGHGDLQWFAPEVAMGLPEG